ACAPACSSRTSRRFAASRSTSRTARPCRTPSMTSGFRSARARICRGRPDTFPHLEAAIPHLVGEPARTARVEELAFVQHEHFTAEFGFVEILGAPHDGKALAGEVADHFPQFAARGGIDAHSRLIEQEQSGMPPQ